MSELPEGWEVSALSDLGTLISGVGFPERLQNKKGLIYPFFKVGDLGKVESGKPLVYSEHTINEEIAKSLKATIIPRNSIAFAKIGMAIRLNRRRLVGVPSCIDNNLMAVVPSEAVLPRYLLRFLETVDFMPLTQATTVPALRKSDLERVEVPLPPLHEQRRIAAKLDVLLSKVGACQQQLADFPQLLKRFRQSVIDAACSGRLTADWRDTTDDDDDLPAGWQWVQLDDLLPGGGIFDGPFGSNLKTSDYTDSGVRVVRLENIGHLTFFDEKETFISKEKYSTLTKHTVGQGDIIFSSFIADDIRACVLPHFKTKAIAKADCFCLRPDERQVDPTYLTFQLVTRESYNRLLEDVHGATRPRVNTTQLRRLQVRVCPLPEQQEIVRRVEALFKTADALEARYLKAKEHVDKLAHSILNKAFKGELVPTEAELARREGRDYEPASALLDRVRQERSLPQSAAKQSPKQAPRPIRRAGKKKDTATRSLF